MKFNDFYAGREFEAYQFLGAHVESNGVTFRTYAPKAGSVSVIGEFNDWKETPMLRIHDGQFFEVHIPNAKAGQMYKFRIYHRSGRFIDHCDPYAFHSEVRPANASIVYDMKRYRFHDDLWESQKRHDVNKPINIYELHFGSWRKKADTTDPSGWYRYEELGQYLIPYLKDMSYNYVEIMPLNEYPSDESWGYQATGYFSPTSRYGQPDGLRQFVDECHQNGIGVIMDFVPVHFAVNDYALWRYDGTPLYEHPDDSVGRSEWGSNNFMHERGDVCSFLSSAAYYWLKEYHIDGLRLDAVGNLIYWQGDSSRGENKGAMQFLRDMNSGLKKRLPETLLFAEDSSSWQGVTKSVSQKGLGFDYKWDLGWMNDTLNYFSTDFKLRTQEDIYHKLTWSMMYFYNEHFVLPFSHDEVVHGKKTIVDKMYGCYEQKFASAKACYLYMYAHPGKKLNFMGNELGQLREWDEKREQDWMLLDYPIHDAFHRFMHDLNAVYLYHPSLSANDYKEAGFKWVDCHQEDKCVYVFKRTGGNEVLLALFNFSDEMQTYKYEPDYPEKCRMLMTSDFDIYGGDTKHHHRSHTIKKSHTFKLPPLSGSYYLIEMVK